MTVQPKEGPEDQVAGQDSTGAEARAAANDDVREAAVDQGTATPAVEEQLREELSATRDRLLRALADLDNQRKRMDRERQQLRTSYVSAPLREFLGVVDNLDRALQAEASEDDFRAGVEMIQRQMTDLLRRFDVEPVESLSAAFDPNLHEAVAREESADVEQPTVVQELRKGYTMGSTLLRAAMVRVAMPAPAVREDAPPDGIETADGGGAESDAAAGGG
jgi:molecular chaperone GrpE